MKKLHVISSERSERHNINEITTSHFLNAPRNDKFYAFTLAEVLITLGIIGVVAALTLPSVINKFRAKALETAFKRSYSNVSNAILKTKIELNSDNLHKDFVVFDVNSGSYQDISQLRNTFLSQLGEKYTYKELSNYHLINYSGTAECSAKELGWCPHPNYILKDGSSVSLLVNSGIIFIQVDTNGPYKMPNRYGHDVFNFMIQNGQNDKIILPKQSKLYTEEELKKQNYQFKAGDPCSIKSNQGANGLGCAWYAFNNINPDDETKTYWDNLPK